MALGYGAGTVIYNLGLIKEKVVKAIQNADGRVPERDDLIPAYARSDVIDGDYEVLDREE